MGGVFGKNKRPCVFPKRIVLYKAKGKKTPRTAGMFHDASTWTGENHFHSARIGRTPKGPEPSAVELVLGSPASESAARDKQDTGEQAASLHVQRAHALSSVTAGEAQDAEVSQNPDTEPSTEVVHHQELTEQADQEALSARGSPEENSKSDVVLHPTNSSTPSEWLSCEGREVTPLTRTTVKAEVHVSADVQGGPSKVRAATVESELLSGAEHEAGAVCVSEETCVGNADQEEPVQKDVDSPAALGSTEESELPCKSTEPREGITNTQISAEEQAVEEQVCCAAKTPPDLQLEQNAEAAVTEDRENAFEPKQAEERTEVCDGQISKDIPCCLAETQAALQEKIKASSGEKPEEH